VAILARETLETPGRTCALVTPDATLARRVSARLERWGVTADSSAGQPLASAPVAVLASLVARHVADATDPVTLLAILKHPLTRLGAPDGPGSARRTLEREGLRGPRPASWQALVARLERGMADDPRRGPPSPARAAAIAAAIALIGELRDALGIAAAAFSAGDAPAAQAARAMAAAMESLARGPKGGSGQLWGGQAGEATAALVSRLIGESEGLPPVTRAGFSDLLDGLLARERVRPGGATHPRLKIMGVLESRLIRADRLILAGLEEGVWPQAAPLDPFLSRPMREKLGLPPPERRIGLSAHDFAQAAAAPEVILIHAERRAGAPAVACRWLWRLRVLACGAGHAIPARADALAWARRLDGPILAAPPALLAAPRPRPRPPVAARPRRLSVTGVELWVRDPYALYARDILRLRPLDPPDQAVDALARGSAIHRAVERFARDWPGELPEGAEALIEDLLGEALLEAGIEDSRLARERALARNLAPWFAAFERGRRSGATLHVEASGELAFDAKAGPFTLTARADRLEERSDRVDIIDFKTGAPPTIKEVLCGAAPQLSLTGAIIAAGGFACVGPATPGELVYVRLRGTRKPGEERFPAEAHEGADVAAEALAGLKRRVAAFDAEASAYVSWALPKYRGRHGGDYDHLARFWEWCVIGDPEEGAP
jgi:ATP-dependent helicase/nuclease subunit B